MTPAPPDIGAELECLRSVGVTPSSVAVENGMAIHMVSEDDIMRVIDACLTEGLEVPCLLMADLGSGAGWAVCDGSGGCFADDFMTRECAVRWLTGDFEDSDDLHDRDGRIACGVRA